MVVIITRRWCYFRLANAKCKSPWSTIAIMIIIIGSVCNTEHQPPRRTNYMYRFTFTAQQCSLLFSPPTIAAPPKFKVCVEIQCDRRRRRRRRPKSNKSSSRSRGSTEKNIPTCIYFRFAIVNVTDANVERIYCCWKMPRSCWIGDRSGQAVPRRRHDRQESKNH